VSDHLRPRLGLRLGSCLPGLVGLPLAALCVVSGALVADPWSAALLLACAAGFAGAGISPGWAICVEIGGTHSAVVSGAMNTFGNLGGALCPVVVGFCVDRFHSWTLPLLSIALLYLASGACWLAIDPERKLEASAR
jgi:MFS family permease